MDIKESLKIFDTLSQETRLQVFRLLVQAGPEGLSASAIGDGLGILHNTLSFHLSHLSNAGIVTSCRKGRYVFYSANFELMRDFIAFMVQDCCSKQQVKIQQPDTKNCLVIELNSCCPSIKE
ncbi:TPA: ArsR/SmtB family transcription factor [Legionella pneumophila]|uniref:ArsR/SmtB family transcription factor n=1 Tax=Legionella pneumophila TaxID=446 RepID=UPI000787C7AC|nr:metalloregulator ArsR/SmtB family transcription factor [Legionella pneumophila]HAT1749717.1 helix-turn-helix transcriptional regulator [Legionella pneumophila]HAT1881550.1 helix-turn-helix transcriptional regulator [Legionella pneumophila]HAT2055193.1 helix-turn-helix transcriptional regulator [Legionella pneumophila]HAT2113458.1 helix-turn-helix transcriptional regulator [Legionella pneumophila]HAT8721371.1 metalloregulator ArsR/SmtB family transcription factor [Legionella pneumophila]